MNKLLISALALFAFASCAKLQHDEPVAPVSQGERVTVSFEKEPITSRAFFDPATTTEV